jgi:hypothetical protein
VAHLSSVGQRPAPESYLTQLKNAEKLNCILGGFAQNSPAGGCRLKRRIPSWDRAAGESLHIPPSARPAYLPGAAIGRARAPA